MTNETDTEVRAAYASLYAAKKLQERWDYRFYGLLGPTQLTSYKNKITNEKIRLVLLLNLI